MNTKPKGRRPLTETEIEDGRTRILATARSLFIRQGYRSVSMRALADGLDMSPMSLYRYYPNKRAILVHIWHDIFARLFADCQAAAVAAPDPAAAVSAYACTFVGYWVTHPDNYMMVYGEIDAPVAGESFFADSSMVADELQTIARLLETAGVEKARQEAVRQQFLCAMHGVCHSLVTIPEMRWQPHHVLMDGLVAALLRA